VLQSKEAAWGIEAPVTFANQMAPVLGRAGRPPVTFPSRDGLRDLASRLDRSHGYGRLHHESMVHGYCDTGGPIVCGKTVYLFCESNTGAFGEDVSLNGEGTIKHGSKCVYEGDHSRVSVWFRHKSRTAPQIYSINSYYQLAK
jgi:hypothetical protein